MPGRFFCGAFLNPLNAVRFPSLFRPVSKRFQNRRRTGINNNLLPVIFTRLMALPFIQYLTDAQRNIGTGSINYNKPLIKFNHHPLMGTERLKKVLSIPPCPYPFPKLFMFAFPFCVAAKRKKRARSLAKKLGAGGKSKESACIRKSWASPAGKRSAVASHSRLRIENVSCGEEPGNCRPSPEPAKKISLYSIQSHLKISHKMLVWKIRKILSKLKAESAIPHTLLSVKNAFEEIFDIVHVKKKACRLFYP